MPVVGKVNVTPVEEKAVEEEQFIYPNKQVTLYVLWAS